MANTRIKAKNKDIEIFDRLAIKQYLKNNKNGDFRFIEDSYQHFNRLGVRFIQALLDEVVLITREKSRAKKGNKTTRFYNLSDKKLSQAFDRILLKGGSERE